MKILIKTVPKLVGFGVCLWGGTFLETNVLLGGIMGVLYMISLSLEDVGDHISDKNF